MKLIIGLGNPGKEYENTRHNIGFMCLDKYLGDVKWKKKFNSLFFEVIENKEKVVFVKPQTYINLSGSAVFSFLKFYKTDISHLFIIHDDLDLEIGLFKIKTDSGSGGHNGIKSVIDCLQTEKFNRLKIGISNNKDMDTADYVLSKFSKKEALLIDEVLEKAKTIIADFIDHDIETTMNHIGENL